MVKFTTFFSLLFALLLNNTAVLAEPVAGLYDVEMLVIDESSDARLVAFSKGLDEVFIRISGDSRVMASLKRPPASRYVQQFSYMPAENPQINEDGELLSHQLKVQYNGSLMEKYLIQQGIPVWDEHRQQLLLWLTVRDGRNEYVLKDADRSLIKTAMMDALKRRGIPDYWPLYDLKDQQIVKAADIRGGFKEPLSKASQRYGNGPILAGSMMWNGVQWQSSWSLLMDTTEHYWSQVEADYVKLLDAAVDRAADTMGNAYAIDAASADKAYSAVRLEVQGISSIEQYSRVEKYLSKLPAVREVSPLTLDARSAIFLLRLRSDEQDFIQLIHNGTEMIEVEVLDLPLPEPQKTGTGTQPAVPPTVTVDLPAADATQVADQEPSGLEVPAEMGEGQEADLNAGLNAGKEQRPGMYSALPLYHYKLIN